MMMHAFLTTHDCKKLPGPEDMPMAAMGHGYVHCTQLYGKKTSIKTSNLNHWYSLENDHKLESTVLQNSPRAEM